MATIRKLLVRVKRSFGPKPIWLTEYGYQSNPPDMFLGVPLKRQARMVSLAAMRAWRLPRVTMLFQYLYRDEPRAQPLPDRARLRERPPETVAAGIQAAVRADEPKRVRAVVWGQIRDGRPGRKPYRLEVLRKNAWKPVGPDRLTNDHGVFVRTIRLKRGALLRVWSPSQRRFSLQLRIR